MFIDTHCHLLKEDYANIDEIINQLGNSIIIISGTNPENNKEIVKLCQKYNNVYGTVGYHPEEVKNIQDEDLLDLENLLKEPKIVGIGEIGLDYYWVKDNKEQQQDLFIKQLRLALKYNKPVVIHCREAIEDTYNILKQEGIKNGIMHCYSGSLEMAHKFIDLGFKLGIGGVITFKNATKLKEVVKNISSEYIVLETDSPYLSPEPFRGTKNSPLNIKIIAEEIARLKESSVDQILKITTDNALSQFDIRL